MLVAGADQDHEDGRRNLAFPFHLPEAAPPIGVGHLRLRPSRQCREFERRVPSLGASLISTGRNGMAKRDRVGAPQFQARSTRGPRTVPRSSVPYIPSTPSGDIGDSSTRTNFSSKWLRPCEGSGFGRGAPQPRQSPNSSIREALDFLQRRVLLGPVVSCRSDSLHQRCAQRTRTALNRSISAIFFKIIVGEEFVHLRAKIPIPIFHTSQSSFDSICRYHWCE